TPVTKSSAAPSSRGARRLRLAIALTSASARPSFRAGRAMTDRELGAGRAIPESDADKLARYEHALRRLAVGALWPALPHPHVAIGRIAAGLLAGAELEQVLAELRRRDG